MKKTVNPYEKKKSTKRRRITRKQRTALLCVLLAAVLLIGLAVVSRAALSQAGSDPHAGHNHANENSSANSGGHYEGDGHNHGATNAGTSGSKLRYQLYKSGDTYSYAIYGAKNELLLKKDKLPMEPVKMPANDSLTLVYFKSNEQGYTVGETVYCDEKNGRISDAFHGAIDTDGVRVAYCNADDTAVIVQDLFDKKTYYKEYPLANVYTDGDYSIANGKLHADKKTVTVSYLIGPNPTTDTRSITIPLYE